MGYMPREDPICDIPPGRRIPPQGGSVTAPPRPALKNRPLEYVTRKPENSDPEETRKEKYEKLAKFFSQLKRSRSPSGLPVGI